MGNGERIYITSLKKKLLRLRKSLIKLILVLEEILDGRPKPRVLALFLFLALCSPVWFTG